MRILLVEDDVRLACGYLRHLERAGHIVDVTHGAEAVCNVPFSRQPAAERWLLGRSGQKGGWV